MFPRKGFVLFVVITLQWQASAVTVGDGNNIPKLKKGWGLDVSEKLQSLEYGKYLNDVFQLLEGAEGFAKKMNDEFEAEGFGGIKVIDKFHKIVPTDVRSKLDELKRIEVRRLTRYSVKLRQQNKKDEEIISEMKQKFRHLDIRQHDNFGPEDLRKLINETTKHLEAIENYRRQSFKEYEMLKHLEFEEMLKRLTPEERKKVENHTEELKKYHKRRPPMYIPLSMPHLLDVWEHMDRMNRELFNQRTFFQKHDLNGDEFWDEEEFKTLLVLEVNHAYNASIAMYDEREKEEELQRMWDYAYENVDRNKDRLIDYQEFIIHARLKDMTDVEFWESIGNKPEFTQEEFDMYAREHRDEVNKLIDEGKIKLPETDVIANLKSEWNAENSEENNLV